MRDAVILIVAPLTLLGAQQITGDDAAAEILGAAFPGMTVRKVDRTINDSWRMGRNLFFPDALAREPVYIVDGQPEGAHERCAASSALSTPNEEKPARRRELRMRACPWPGKKDDVLAIVQYRFLDARPPGSCESIGRLFHLDRRGGMLRNKDSFVFDTTHHRALNGIRLVDLDGDGIEELLVETNAGGGGGHASHLVVLSLIQATFTQWLNVPSRLDEWHGKEEEYVQTIDVARTVSTGGRRFCFTKTAFTLSGDRLPRPRISHPCYPRFAGPSARARFFASE